MKTIISILIILSSINISAQIGIGIDEPSSESVSLEFGSENRGLILSYVTSTQDVDNNGGVNGTMVFDSSDNKVKLKTNDGWQDLSIDPTGTSDLTIQQNKIEFEDSKVAIGNNAETDQTAGILVLTDSDKVMVLPKVASPHLSIIQPAAGMIVYDTEKHQLAIYNGTVWTFWKP